MTDRQSLSQVLFNEKLTPTRKRPAGEFRARDAFAITCTCGDVEIPVHAVKDDAGKCPRCATTVTLITKPITQLADGRMVEV